MKSLLFTFSFLFSKALLSQTFGVVLNHAIEIKAKPNLSSKAIAKVTENQIVSILQKSKKLDFWKQSDSCEHFPWLKVRYKNKEGWVLGKNVFQLLENDKKLPQFELNIDNQNYKLISARDYGHGFVEYDNNGNYIDTYGCPEFYAIGLWSKTTNKVIFFPNSTAIEHSKDYFSTKTWGIFDDNSFRERIVEFSKKDDKALHCKVFSSLQEDCVEYQLELFFGAKPDLKLINYQRINDEDCNKSSLMQN